MAFDGGRDNWEDEGQASLLVLVIASLVPWVLIALAAKLWFG